MKHKTWLPVFSGFYNTIWSQDSGISDYLYEDKELTYDDLEIDNEQYENDLVKELCTIIARRLEAFVRSIALERVYHPKEYNYSTDAGYVIVDVKKLKLRNYMLKHERELEQYLTRYQSRDGFSSWYESDVESWKIATNEYTEFGGDHDRKHHRLGSILNFICEQLEITEESLYYETQTRIDSYIKVKPKEIKP